MHPLELNHISRDRKYAGCALEVCDMAWRVRALRTAVLGDLLTSERNISTSCPVFLLRNTHLHSPWALCWHTVVSICIRCRK